MAVKVVVIGSVDCALRTFFTKLAKIHAKNSFSIAIILGDLFGSASTETALDEISALFQGVVSVPLPTYFTIGNNKLPERVIEKLETEDEVCTNLFYLGRRGTVKTSEGVRIVTLGGLYDPVNSEQNPFTKYTPNYTDSDARTLHGAHDADILITNQWPQGVQSRSQVNLPDGVTAPEGVKCLSDLCSVLRPKYFFSTSPEFFYEREPFFHAPNESGARPLTRFISLAAFNNQSKQKWLYAFSLEPASEPPAVIPPGATASPFTTVPPKRKTLPDQQESFSRFRSSDDHHHRRGKRQRQPPPTPGECFFCLSNPNLATHLITSIGEDSYLTTAKGPLTTSNIFPTLPFPGHILIIPLSHLPTISSIPDAAVRTSTYAEMQRYRAALHQMVQDKTNRQLGGVTWEVSRSNGIHVHWQFLPMSADKIRSGLVEAAFKVEAENDHYPKFETRDIGDGSGEIEYFRMWLWSPPETSDQESQNGTTGKSREKSLVLRLSHDFRFDLQFGRRVLAKLLELDNRANWKDATQTQEEEEEDAAAFKEAFKPYDFTQEDV